MAIDPRTVHQENLGDTLFKNALEEALDGPGRPEYQIFTVHWTDDIGNPRAARGRIFLQEAPPTERRTVSHGSETIYSSYKIAVTAPTLAFEDHDDVVAHDIPISRITRIFLD